MNFNFPSIEHLSSVGKDFFGKDLFINDSKSVCTLNEDDKVGSILKVGAPQVPPPLCRPITSQDVSIFNVDAILEK